jgi:glycosyltransferase involved in cell wall biosynthesis
MSVTVSAESAYPALAAGPRVRLVGFAGHLAKHGIELRYRPTLTDREYAAISAPGGSGAIPRKAAALAAGAARAMRTHGDADLTLVHRLRFLTPLPLVEPRRQVDLYDFDDALWAGSTMPSNRGFGWLKREAARWDTYVRRARVVIAGNAYLADHARRHARRVEVIPSCVEPSIQPTRRHAEQEVVRVGWIGSASTAAYLGQLMPVFERLNARDRRATLVLVGGAARLRAPWIENVPWSRETEHELLAGFDIGVMPMPDDPWTRGKCGYKLLQYFAAGVPAIASPVGVNATIVDAERGRLATTTGEWVSALEELIGDAAIRSELGAAGREFVEREYSYGRWAPELAGLIAQL